MKIRFADPETGRFSEAEIETYRVMHERIELLGIAGENLVKGDYLMIDPDTKMIVNCGMDDQGNIYRIKK